MSQATCPMPKDLTEACENSKSNFGLRYKKYFKWNGNEIDKKFDSWRTKFEEYKKTVQDPLKSRHLGQITFCKEYKKIGLLTVTITAKLKSPLIIGLGDSHPSETGMILDHNLGIPYIPASSLKGITRFSHIVNLIEGLSKEDLGKEFTLEGNDLKEDEKTLIPQIFGFSNKDGSQRGSVIFLDAYPKAPPALMVDIMNPHFNNYYQKNDWPKDTCAPIPINFLAVKPETEFVFRMVAKNEELIEPAKKALITALTEEGVGAKTAIGYGRFEINSYDEPPEFIDEIVSAEKEKEIEKLDEMSKEDSIIYEIKSLPADSGNIGELVKKCLEDKELPNKIFELLKQRLIEIDQWKPDGSKQRKEKMRQRNEKIEARIQ